MTKNPMLSGDHFRLGTFSSNCSSGMTPTKIAERWDNSWDNNLALGKMLDEAGIDFMLPIARWIGYGGETDFHGGVLETMTWAAGLLASTKNIAVFATIHTAANHPAVVAKQIATIDQIGHGRTRRHQRAECDSCKFQFHPGSPPRRSCGRRRVCRVYQQDVRRRRARLRYLLSSGFVVNRPLPRSSFSLRCRA